MANKQVAAFVKNYGGNFGGNGISTQFGNPNTERTYFDPSSNQNFTFENGQVKFITPSTSSSGLLQKIGAIGSETLHLEESAAEKAAQYVAHTVEDVASAGFHAVKTIPELAYSAYKTYEANSQVSNLTKNLQQATADYKAGKLSKAAYQLKIKEINQGLEQANNTSKQALSSATDVRNHVGDVAETAVNILSLGKAKSLESIAESGGKELATEGLTGLTNKIGTYAEDILSKIPAVRDLFARNAEKMALPTEMTSQSITRNLKNIAFGLLIKRPIVYQTNIGLAQDVYKDILSGNYPQALKDSAWIGAQTISGGPLGWFFRTGDKLTSKIGELASGTNSFIDEVSKSIGNKSPAQITDYLNNLEKNNPKEFKRATNILKIAQEVNLQASDNDAIKAAQALTSHYDQHGIDLAQLTPSQIVDDMDKWSQADEIARKLSPKDEPTEYVAVRWDSKAKSALAKRVQEAGNDVQAMTQAVADLASQPGVGWGNNQLLVSRITRAIMDSGSAEEAASKIRKISTVSTLAKDIPKKEAKKLAKLGYSVAEPFGGRKTPKIDLNDTRKLVTMASNGNTDIFDETVSPVPALDTLTNALRRFGLTPESNTRVSYDKLSEALVSNLEELNAAQELGLAGEDSARGGKFILSRLQNYINKQSPNPYLNIGTLGRGNQSALQDIRQMTLKEIQEALPGTTKDTAKKLQSAILKAYTDVPLEFRGLGIKAFDYAYRVPGAKNYFRIQSALRYTYNPFFRLQELLETKTLTKMQSNNLLWRTIGGTKAELDRVGQLLDDSGIFTTGYTGEATQDLTLGRIHANLLKTQRRDLAGLAMSIAQRQGKSVEDLISDNPEQLADALRVIVQYPTKGLLNSPLARTLNIAFFPMRYNLKVATLAAQKVASLPPTIQVATLHSLLSLSAWMKSPEGIQWQSDNSDAIQVFNYFSVLNNIQSVLNRLHGKPASVSDIGLLGGLPFGVISQILDNEGVINLNTPYVDPKTGSVLPEYIPQTTKAKAAVALESLINSMFTYPGRVIGLPGKEAQVRDLVGHFIDTNGSDFSQQYRLQDLTPLQQEWIKVLSNKNVTQDQLDELYVSPANGEFNWFTLPPSNLPQAVPVLSRSQVAAEKSAAKSPKTKKKALPIPAEGQPLAL